MQAGDKIGRYLLEGRVGEGAMAAVFATRHPLLARRLAIKVLKPEVREDGEFVRRFLDDARAADALDHPHIVKVIDVDDADGAPFIVMELVEGTSLDAAIAERGRLPVEEAARVAREVASALAAAHKAGIVHRDVKPSNILIDGASGAAKLTDFGAAKRQDGDGLTRSVHGQLIGTPRYMAPEQIAGQPVDGRSDLFALGTTLYEMLAGTPAFPGDNLGGVAYAIMHGAPTPLGELRPDVPPALAALVERLLAKTPDDRPANAEAALAELEALAVEPAPTPALDPAATTGAESSTMSPPPVEPPPSRTRVPSSPPSRRPLVGGIAAAVLVAVGLGYLLTRDGEEPTPAPPSADQPVVATTETPQPGPGPAAPSPSTPEPPAAVQPPPAVAAPEPPPPQAEAAPPPVMAGPPEPIPPGGEQGTASAETPLPPEPSPTPAPPPVMTTPTAPPPANAEPPRVETAFLTPPPPDGACGSGCRSAKELVSLVEPADAGPEVRLNRADGVYLEQDYVVLDVRAPATMGGFLYVDLLTDAGAAFHLLPEPMRPENAIAAGESVSIGVERSGRRAGVRPRQAAPPFGPAYLVAIVTERALPERPLAIEEPLDGYLRSLAEALRAGSAGRSTMRVVPVEFRPRPEPPVASP